MNITLLYLLTPVLPDSTLLDEVITPIAKTVTQQATHDFSGMNIEQIAMTILGMGMTYLLGVSKSIKEAIKSIAFLKALSPNEKGKTILDKIVNTQKEEIKGIKSIHSLVNTQNENVIGLTKTVKELAKSIDNNSSKTALLVTVIDNNTAQTGLLVSALAKKFNVEEST